VRPLDCASRGKLVSAGISAVTSDDNGIDLISDVFDDSTQMYCCQYVVLSLASSHHLKIVDSTLKYNWKVTAGKQNGQLCLSVLMKLVALYHL
jgi:hypothetical protein